MKLNKVDGQDTITDALGISKERATALDAVVKSVEDKIDPINGTVDDSLHQIADQCETPEELTYCVFQFGATFQRALMAKAIASEPSFAGEGDDSNDDGPGWLD